PEPYTAQFSTADAKAAGLLGKTGPWSQYPARMRQMRARAFALRDQFAGVLKGLAIREDQEGVAGGDDKRFSHSLIKRKLESQSKKGPYIPPQEIKIDKDPNPESAQDMPQLISEAQVERLLLCRQHNISEEKLKIQINAVLGAQSPSQILAKDF